MDGSPYSEGRRKRLSSNISEVDGVHESDSESSNCEDAENAQFITPVQSEVLSRQWIVDDGFRFPLYVTDQKHLGFKTPGPEDLTIEHLVDWIGGQREVVVTTVRNVRRTTWCAVPGVRGGRTW